MSWCFLHSNCSKRQSLSMASVNLFDCFLPIDRKRYFEAQTTAFEVLRAIICLMQTGILWWNGFSQSHLATRPVDPFQNQCSNCFFFFRFWCTRNIKFRKTLLSRRNRNYQLHHLQSLPSFAFFRNSKMSKWHIWLLIDSWNLTAAIRNSVRGRTEFCKITMTSAGVIFTPPTPLPIIDRRPPPWWIFLSPPSLPLPLKPKMVAIIFVEKLTSTCSPTTAMNNS